MQVYCLSFPLNCFVKERSMTLAETLTIFAKVVKYNLNSEVAVLEGIKGLIK